MMPRPRHHADATLNGRLKLRDELHALAPAVLGAYPSAAVMLAEERLAGTLQIQPGEVWAGGETLPPTMRRFVHEANGCPAVDSCGASEFLSLASERRGLLASCTNHAGCVPGAAGVPGVRIHRRAGQFHWRGRATRAAADQRQCGKQEAVYSSLHAVPRIRAAEVRGCGAVID